MMGTFGGALEARQIDASNGKLTAEVTGEVEEAGWRSSHSQNSRFDASSCTGRHKRESGASARRLCYELPLIQDITQRDSTDVFV